MSMQKGKGSLETRSISIKKSKRSFAITCIAVILIVIVMIAIPFKIANSENSKDSHAKVLLGGQTFCLNFIDEGHCFIRKYEEHPTTQDFSIVQIDNTPIQFVEYYSNALENFNGNMVKIKYTYKNKLYEEVVDKSVLQKYTPITIAISTGKVSFYLPELSLALCYAHPVSYNNPKGVFYKAKTIKVEDSHSSIKTFPDAIGTVEYESKYGVAMKYDKENEYFADLPEIEIAKKNEVSLGKAYLYTDYGKGLNFYEIEITALDDRKIEYFNSFIYTSEVAWRGLTGENFAFKITDSGMLADGISELGFMGASGSPIIQNNRLVGLAGYEGYGIYAENVYNYMIEENENDGMLRINDNSIDDTSKMNEESYAKQERIMVIPGTQGIITNTRSFGGYVQFVENKDTEIKRGDIIIDINGMPTINNPNINAYIEYQQTEECDEIVITYIRDNGLHKTSIPKGVSLGITTYNDAWTEYGYISMIDPITYRYAGKSYSELDSYKPNPFSGFIIETYYNYDSNEKKLTNVSNNQVIGTITNVGKALYGYIEPFNYEKDKLVEIAPKDEIKNGDAVIEVKMYTDHLYYKEYDVILTCDEDGISLESKKQDDITDGFAQINISGAPIFQNGRLVGVYKGKLDDFHAKAWYAIDVYNEMINTAE